MHHWNTCSDVLTNLGAISDLPINRYLSDKQIMCQILYILTHMSQWIEHY